MTNSYVDNSHVKWDNVPRKSSDTDEMKYKRRDILGTALPINDHDDRYKYLA